MLPTLRFGGFFCFVYILHCFVYLVGCLVGLDWLVDWLGLFGLAFKQLLVEAWKRRPNMNI